MSRDDGSADGAAVRIHLTNITGIGAVQLVGSLLPTLEMTPGYRVETEYLPGRGALRDHAPRSSATSIVPYRRRLPNAISRVLECTVFGGRFDGKTPLLVLGDIPIRCSARQTVLVQSGLLTEGGKSARRLGALKYWVARRLVRLNLSCVSAFVVQTEAMRAALIDSYPDMTAPVHVIGQPAPRWLLEAGLKRTGRVGAPGSDLRLVYPAAPYPHKNHQLLSGISPMDAPAWPVAELRLTLPATSNPNSRVPWISCVGTIDPPAVIEGYRGADGLLFLSLAESYGFPLVEAMTVGLPIVCPDAEYARGLCGDEATYFDPRSVDSLRRAVTLLKNRLDAGWWPDWSEQVSRLPLSWEAVADAMLQVAAGGSQDGRS